MRPLKPMVGVVESLELIGSGPVGLVRTQESTGFLKRKAHLIVVAFIGLHLDPVGNVVLGPSRTVTYRRPRSQLRAPRDYVKALLNHQEGDVTATYARWHMFEEKREAVMAIEAAVFPPPAAAPWLQS